MRIGPARDVAGREDAGRARLQKLVDEYAAIDLQSRLLRKLQARPHANTEDDEIGLERAATLERDFASRRSP